MFIGHFAVGFGVKKAVPGVSLGWLFLAAQFLDLMWPTLLLLNIEHVAINHDPNQLTPLTFTDYPVSHSLLMALVWSFLFGLIYWLFKKNTSYAVILALCVLSHWVLDFMVHYPDLPLYPGNCTGNYCIKVGLKLWSLPVVENIVETVLFIVGVLLYLRATVAKNKVGNYVLWILIALLMIAHFASVFAPAPGDVKMVAWGAQLMWIFVALAFWVDHNRTGVKLDPLL